MNVKQMILEAIKDAMADGLVNADLDCGCPKEDLAPCGEIELECELAYGRILGKTEHIDQCRPGDMFFYPLSGGRGYGGHK